MRRSLQILMPLLLFSHMSFGAGSIQHIVVIIQENRTFDEYEGTMSIPGQTINGFSDPGSPTGPSKLNGTVELVHADPTLDTTCGNHTHQASVDSIDGGLMDGFAQCVGGKSPGIACNLITGSPCTGGGTCSNCYQYFTSSDLPWFYQMATTYGTSDNFFSGMSGPSMPNHFIAIAATTNDIVDNPDRIGITGPGQYNIWTCQVTDASGVIPTAAPDAYSSDNGSFGKVALNDISSTSTAINYHQGICGGKCLGGTRERQYCATDADCGAGYSCSYHPDFPNTRCQCTADQISGSQTACIDKNPTTCTPEPPPGVNNCQLTRTYSGSTAQPGNLCPSVTTLFDRLGGNHTHRWYGAPENGEGPNAGYDWVAAAYTPSVFNSPNHISTYQQFLKDVSDPTGNSLPAVSFITPTNLNSEHSGAGTVSNGQAYLQITVQAITSNPALYSSTVIFVYYDDYGGFYDHVPPPTVGIPQYDNMGVGIRVPNLCIGPYCKNAVAHTFMTPDSITKCIEDFAFGHQSGKGYTGGTYLTARDTIAHSACAADGSGFIDLTQTPIPPHNMPIFETTAPLVKHSAPEVRGNGPDLVELVERGWRRIFPRKGFREEGEEAENRPQLSTQRPCAEGYLPETALYKGTPISVCVWHGLKTGNILLPGQAEGDADEPDTNVKDAH